MARTYYLTRPHSSHHLDHSRARGYALAALVGCSAVLSGCAQEGIGIDDSSNSQSDDATGSEQNTTSTTTDSDVGDGSDSTQDTGSTSEQTGESGEDNSSTGQTTTQDSSDDSTQTSDSTDDTSDSTSQDSTSEETDTTTDDSECPGRGMTFMSLTDPSCADGKYCEKLPNLSVDLAADIADLKTKTTAADIADVSMKILEAAYPFGAKMIKGGGANCHTMWIERLTNEWDSGLGLSVHECGHFYDDTANRYFISEGVTIDWSKDDFFWRQEITGDEFHMQIPDAKANKTYFDVGSTTGDQGIITMYDEWTQYNHNQPMQYFLYPYPDTKQSYYVEYALNFAWAAPRYFLWAKDHHPEDYAKMMASPEVREATLVLFGQTMFYYDAFAQDTDWEPTAGETRYLDAIREPKIMEMMNDIRKAHGCDGI